MWESRAATAGWLHGLFYLSVLQGDSFLYECVVIRSSTLRLLPFTVLSSRCPMLTYTEARWQGRRCCI